ncbi:MAG: M15 family metallopeptidase [Anaeroplasmataceae bacterium]
MPTRKDLNLLVPEVKEAVEKTLAALKEQDIPIFVSETLRDQNVQQAYYAQGRESLEVVNALRKAAGLYLLKDSDNKKTITNCDGVKNKSNHQVRDESGLGHAIDLVPGLKKEDGSIVMWWNAPHSVWEKIGLIAEQNGLDWCFGGVGNHWKWDSPHFEILSEEARAQLAKENAAKAEAAAEKTAETV